MKLHRVATCTRNLTWETELPDAALQGPLVRALEARGAVIERPLPKLVRIRWQTHRVILVGVRVQIRLSYLVPDDERRHAAEAVFVDVLDALAGA